MCPSCSSASTFGFTRPSEPLDTTPRLWYALRMNGNIVKWGGIAGIIGGSIALYLSGVNESTVTSIVGAVFVLVGIVAGVFKGNAKKEDDEYDTSPGA